MFVVFLCWSMLGLMTHCAEKHEPSVSKLNSEAMAGFVSDRISSCSNDDPETGCPPGLFCNETCKCGHYPYRSMKCDEVKSTSAVLDCYCATFDETKNVTLLGACIYNCGYLDKDLVDSVYHPLPNSTKQNNTVCMSFRRTGALCGRCLPHHFPLAYSFDMNCVQCSHVGWNWGRYIMAAYLPLTLFCTLVFFFQLNAVTSHLHPVIMYSQAISLPAMSRLLILSVRTQAAYQSQVLLKILLSLYGIWNLDFFRPFYSDICLGIGLLPTLALDYAIAVYPFILMAISSLLVHFYDKKYRLLLLLWKPFRAMFLFFKMNWNIKTSMIDSFTTFFFLSNVKCLSVTFDLLVPVHIYELHQDGNKHTFGLYYSGDTEYLGREHLPYAILAMIVFTVFVTLPFLILALYPCAFFQKFMNCIPIHWHILRTFMDAFQGCYKDGTEPGTRDCRWFAASFFFVRFLFFVICAITQTSAYFFISAIVLLLFALLIINIQPFKRPMAHYSKINATFFTLLAINYITLCGLDTASIKIEQFVTVFSILIMITGIIPLLYALMIIAYWAFSQRRFRFRLANKIRGWRRGYSSMEEEHIDTERYTAVDQSDNNMAVF